MSTEPPLTDEEISAVAEQLKEHSGVYTRRDIIAAAAATGSLGVLGALGIDDAEASHGVGRAGEPGDPLEAVYANKIGDASEPTESVVTEYAEFVENEIDFGEYGGTTPVLIDTDNSEAIVIRSAASALSDYGSVKWVDGDNGGNYATLTAHPSNNHLSIYTDDDGDLTNNSTTKRLDVGGGASQVNVRWQGIAKQRVEGESPWLGVRSTLADKSPRIFWEVPDGSGGYNRPYEFVYLDQFGDFNITGPSGILLQFKDDGRTQVEAPMEFQQNEASELVWDSGSSRPSSPVTGQRFFDTSIGQPIWHDGADWVDAQGTVV